MANYSLKWIVLSTLFLFRLYSSTSINNLLNFYTSWESNFLILDNIVSLLSGRTITQENSRIITITGKFATSVDGEIALKNTIASGFQRKEKNLLYQKYFT